MYLYYSYLYFNSRWHFYGFFLYSDYNLGKKVSDENNIESAGGLVPVYVYVNVNFLWFCRVV